MGTRIFVIIDDSTKRRDNIAVQAQAFLGLGRVVVVSRDGYSGPAETVVPPPEADTEPKLRNWINGEFCGGGVFLHVVKSGVEILPGVADFVPALERAMRALDYPVWLSTATDGCNYVYSKYNPRVRIRLDRPECQKIGLEGELYFTSHSNTQWVAYDMDGIEDRDLLRFDERFTIAMFYIIEFLARRKKIGGDGSLFFMNQYLTVGEETAAFRNFAGDGEADGGPDQAKMREEDAAFKALGADYSPDNNIDVVLETLWKKILSKQPSDV